MTIKELENSEWTGYRGLGLILPKIPLFRRDSASRKDRGWLSRQESSHFGAIGISEGTPDRDPDNNPDKVSRFSNRNEVPAMRTIEDIMEHNHTCNNLRGSGFVCGNLAAVIFAHGTVQKSFRIARSSSFVRRGR